MNQLPSPPDLNQEETWSRIMLGMIAGAVYISLWAYGGYSWTSALVSAVVGTLVLVVSAAPLGAAIFLIIKSAKLSFRIGKLIIRRQP